MEILLRQIDNLGIKDQVNKDSIKQGVNYSKLYSLANSGDKAIMTFGWTVALISGCGLPSFVFLIGWVIDSFDPSTTEEDRDEIISLMALIFTLIGVGLWIFSTFYYSAFIIFSERVIKRTRVRYL